LIVKSSKEQILATANLFTQTVDCKDEYLKMRILGLIGNFLENTSEGEYEKENNQIIMEEM
jgi:hypothetical protein